MAEKIDIADLVMCPICFEQFTYPKCLPCFHTFCYQCLKSYIITQLGGEGKKAKEFPCPVCRQKVAVTDQNLTSEKIADTMPGNHLINSLIDRSGVSEKDQDAELCAPCNFDGGKTSAVFWCERCLEPLCENCVEVHKRFIRTTKHEIISIKEMTKEKPLVLLEVEEPCTKHTGKVLEVYCVDHKEMCCVICLATSHRKCEHISTFEEMVTGSIDIESVEQFVDCLSKMEDKTDRLVIKTDENLTTMNSRRDEIMKNVTTIVHQAKDKLDHLQSNFMTKFQQKHKEENVKLTETKERIEIFHQNLKKGQKLLQTVREQGSPKQIFITKEKLKLQLKHHIEGLKVELKDSHCIEYALNMNDMMASVLNTLCSVAEVDVKLTLNLSTRLNEISDDVDRLNKENEQPIDIRTIEVNLEHTVNPGGQITGGTYLPDGRVLLVCCTDKKLRLYDKSGKNLITTLCFDQYPADACTISGFEVVVSFYLKSYLKIYEIQETHIKEMKTMPCKKEPWGLAATKNNIIVGFKSEIDVLSMNGQVVLNFSRVGDHVSCVAVSLTGNIYYIDQDAVVCKSLDSREIRRYTNPNLDRSLSIAVDKFDNVYVCGGDSNNVCVFSSDGRHDKIFPAKLPLYIDLHHIEKRLWIGTVENGCHFYSLK